MNSASQQATSHPAFEWVRSQTIDSLNIVVEEYIHKKTGAVHYHMATDNDENVFLVALRTVPEDSRGVAHILEHTALCGSERYPVRDPFFMMIRRSLNTFMNAFTSSDWTAYPFASQNRKDFDNLLSVYLDAVFFSRLDELDFAQEGHRVEFAEANNSESDLVYKGVVFNEMKGAMSSVPSTLWQTLCKHLFPTTTYHYNSGGDPENIPELSYQQLITFYKSHYHPSNAIFMTYGDIPAAQQQKHFEELALSRFDKLDVHIQVPKEQRYETPIQAQESYALNEEGNADNKTHVVMGWLLGESAHLENLLEAQLLISVLLDNSSSPLQHVLETTELGSSPSPLCGLEDSMRELVFVCGVEGADAKNSAAIEQLILETLQNVADNGVPQDRVEAVLHQLELHQREVGGDGSPYGLQLILTAMGSATHRGDPIAVLNLDPVLEKLHESIKNPEYLKTLARTLLLENPHRVTLVMTPDKQLAAQKEASEAQRLTQLKTTLSDQQKQQIIDQTQALNERQTQKDDESILPKVSLSDVPSDIRIVKGEHTKIQSIPTSSYAQGTNGLVYQQIIIELPELPEDLIAILPYYCNALTEMGVGEQSYLETQARQSSICGSIHAFTSMRGAIDDEQNIKSCLVLSSKALARNQDQQALLMQDTLQNVRFDELDRLKDLISQQRSRREQSVTNNGHALAMSVASSAMSPTAQLNHVLSGLEGIKAVKELDASLESEPGLQHYSSQLSELHDRILKAPKQLLTVAETDKISQTQQHLTTLWEKSSAPETSQPLSLPPIRKTVKQLWLANTQVNFCAKAFPTVPGSHPDSPVLTVLAGFMRNGYLHGAIREQGGAYGGGASQDSNIAAFRMYSYRDPRLTETLNDFDNSINWVLENEHDDEQLEQAILGIIGSLDKPASPAGEAKQAFHNTLYGRSDEYRRQFRQRILSVSLDDLKRVTRTYLKPECASIGVITNQATYEQIRDKISKQDIDVITL